ncbi:MAG: dihydroorotase family protein [Armatimonadota bacterium]|nr:dihydroorotase family protein [Armatimonadota bacterium]MDR7448287.1 dihydroorotase family protein [Armatimonadota bacterium]MDR7458317.1 dihydroorotase family protein [Armatimonadota bacterium]MDR7478380.1 dihydroorotase family protein [Armatimonadota bacterium]MDR7487314.1 dihydroorotase family protein [Armatimonadota bacterium]
MARVDLVVRDCHVVTPDLTFRGWVAVRGGRIVAMGDEGDGPAAEEVLEGRGQVLLPGRVEPHIHLGVHYPFEVDVEQTSAAAVAGGTTVMMPHARAKASYLEVYPAWEQVVAARSHCDVVFHLQIQNRRHIDEIPQYRERFGVLCYKLHLDYRVRAVAELDIEPLDDGDAYLTMRQCAQIDALCALHCEDVEIIRYTLPAVQRTGRRDLQAWTDARPAFCEVADIHTMAYLSELTGCRAVVLHLAAAEGIEAAQRWTQRPLILETLVQFLTVFPEEAGPRIGAIGKMNPPLRDRTNGERLWAGVRSGAIATVGTDHISCEKHETDDLWQATAGMPGIEVALPLLLSEGVHRGRITLQDLVRVACLTPARLYHIDDRKGAIAVGKDADLVLVDMDRERVVSPQTTVSRFKTAANGMRLRGWPTTTIKGGRVVFRDGEVIGPPAGRVLRSY